MISLLYVRLTSTACNGVSGSPAAAGGNSWRQRCDGRRLVADWWPYNDLQRFRGGLSVAKNVYLAILGWRFWPLQTNGFLVATLTLDHIKISTQHRVKEDVSRRTKHALRLYSRLIKGLVCAMQPLDARKWVRFVSVLP